MNLKLGKVVLTAFALLCAPGLRAEVETQMMSDPRYFSIEAIQIEEVDVSEIETQEFLDALVQQYDLANARPAPVGPTIGDGSGVETLNGIVNLAKSLWNIILENQPVVNISVDHANALPMGVSAWTTLSHWQVPKAKAYRVNYLNGFGMNVVDFTFRVLFVPGGKYNGKGAYITNATIVPSSVSVAWGFKFNASAKVSSITNAGSLQDPVAAMQLDMQWIVETPLKYERQEQNFYIRGDGMLLNLSDGSKVSDAK